MRVGILTVSDKGACGERVDTSGPALSEMVGRIGGEVVRTAVVPDDQGRIAATLVEWSDEGLDLILTTGGTGFSPRDVTPEATRSILERETPGISEAIRQAGLAKTRTAALSRAVSGIRKLSLIINLPGSERGARESLEAVLDILPHGLAVLKGTEGECGGGVRRRIVRGKSALLIVVLILGFASTARNAFGLPVPFEKYFSKQKEIRLSTQGLEIGSLWSLAADDAGRIYFLDPRGGQLIVFDEDGRFVRRIGARGQGPGEFISPGSVHIDASRRIYVADSGSRRINVYDSEGTFQTSFLMVSSHGPGDIVTGSQGRVFMAGLGLPKEPESRGDWIQEYDAEGMYVRSFFRDSGPSWVVQMRPYILFDASEDLLYAMQIDRYAVSAFDANGNLVRSFGPPGYFRAPDRSYVMDQKKYRSLEKLKEELWRLMGSWTRPIFMQAVDKRTILVMVAANGLVASSSKAYLIDLWSAQGNLVAEAIPCDHQLLCSDRKGHCYFLLDTDQDEALDKDPEYVIGKFRLNL